MAAYLLDTNILIDVLRQRNKRRDLLRQLAAGGGSIACSVITVGELYVGIQPQEKAGTEELLAELDHYDVDTEIARYAGLLKREWAARGRTLALVDMLIAATAILHKLVLVTTNAKDFPMSELRSYPL